MKHLEGKTVYLRPTGNNTRDGYKVKKAVILKVVRVFVTLKIEDYFYEDKFRYEGNILKGECNSGYVAYETEQDLEDFYEAQKLAKTISKKCSYSSQLEKLGLDKLKQLIKLLEELL
jgi:hypothetical protein